MEAHKSNAPPCLPTLISTWPVFCRVMKKRGRTMSWTRKIQHGSNSGGSSAPDTEVEDIRNLSTQRKTMMGSTVQASCKISQRHPWKGG